MKIELLLAGNKVEINKDIDFVLNKQFTELQDLTSIIVDYTKTISVPMTAHNNELFNNVYKLDHQVLLGQNIINYDPSQKIPMQLLYNSSLVMEGYAVLVSCNLKNKTYDINLYGQLGKIFSDLKEKKLINYTKVNNGFWNNVKMNTATVKESINNYSHLAGWQSDLFTDFFGFAPQLYGTTDLIDTKSFESSNDKIQNFSNIINLKRNIEYGEGYVGDGFDFNQYGEQRTYLTRPYVYVHALFDLISDEINNGDYDGYKLELDWDWFNHQNPYYADMCYFPGRETPVDKGQNVNGSVSWSLTERQFNFPQYYTPTVTTTDLTDFTYSASGNLITLKNSDGSEPSASINLNCDGITLRDRVYNSIKSFNETDFRNNGEWAFWGGNSSPSNIPVRYLGIYDENYELLYKLYLISDEVKCCYDSGGYGFLGLNRDQGRTIFNIWGSLKSDTRNIVPNNFQWKNEGKSGEYCELQQTYNFGTLTLPTNKFRLKMGCDLFNISTLSITKENISTSEYTTLCPFKKLKENYRDNALWGSSGALYSQYFTGIQLLELSSQTYRSHSNWNILDILGEDFNPFTWMLDYVKKYRLFFDIDYNTKKITLSQNYFNYFDKLNVKVDYSKEVKIEPLINTQRNILFGYTDNESRKGVSYKKRFGVNYGDSDFGTGINISKETMKLNPNEEEGVFIPTQTSALTWNNLNSTSAIKYEKLFDTNKMINTLDSERKIQYYPFYCFRDVNVSTDNPYYLTDDTLTQMRTGNYCFLDHYWSTQAPGWVDKKVNGVNVIERMTVLPQFDNYITKSVLTDSFNAAKPMPDEDIEGFDLDEEPANEEESFGTNEVVRIPALNPDFELVEVLDKKWNTWINPITKKEVVKEFIDDWIQIVPGPNTGGETGGDNPSLLPGQSYKTLLFWSTFVQPKEVYNGQVPSNIESYVIYSRWKNYLNELFNINNKKVTCYVMMSYPEFINFKFNKLFVIDGCSFLVNKIIDFNPNSTEPTKVELIQITNPENLR